MDAIQLEVFRHRCNAIAEEMGAALERSAFSSNIQERRDYSCALFDAHGDMIAQAAHIPVHLGAMPRSVEAAIRECGPLQPGDVVLLNDPFCGGTHLPDFTSVAPVYVGTTLVAYSATRAHHADVGGMTPGSMPLSQSIYQEGIIIPPIRLIDRGVRNEAVFALIVRNSRTSDERSGDLAAQLACHAIAQERVCELVDRMGIASFAQATVALISYGERRMQQLIASIPNGVYAAEEFLDSDGISDIPIRIAVQLTISDTTLHIDFSNTDAQCRGPLNAPMAVTESAVLYALRLLDGDDLPASAGLYRPLTWTIPYQSILNPAPPAAVAGGNVETSQRVVDVMLRALSIAIPAHIPAQSAGTMNNWTMGGTRTDGTPFAYYETLGGGMGARAHADGLHAVQTHMTNTRNTPIEAFERLYPVRVESLSIREGSGGQGRHRGGDGLRKAIRFLVPVTLTVLTERRQHAPQGSQGGKPGACGHNTLIDSEIVTLPGKGSFDVESGSVFIIETPAGGGYGHD
ncbi:MAG: hydantoinase B/oxoprolinase family protein [Roseiflexaceae bacterium]